MSASKIDPAKSFSCFDTSEESLLWCNRTDALGLVCAPFVLCIFAFAALSIYLFFQDGYLSNIDTLILVLLLLIAVWCHLKVMFTDPGAVPKMAKPIPRDQHLPHVMCGRCDSYKPPLSHHGEVSSNFMLYEAFDLGRFIAIICTDRISNRCICRMDHYCPWTNNAIGAGNQKVFILFVLYTDIASIYLYVLVAYRLVCFIIFLCYPIYLLLFSINFQLFCNGSKCDEFKDASLLVARVLLFVLVFSILFTSGMLLNQIYGLRNGMGTIDR